MSRGSIAISWARQRESRYAKFSLIIIFSRCASQIGHFV